MEYLANSDRGYENRILCLSFGHFRVSLLLCYEGILRQGLAGVKYKIQLPAPVIGK